MSIEFNIFNSNSSTKKAELVASSKVGDTDNLQVEENFQRNDKKEKRDGLFKDPEQLIIEKIIIAKSELSDILNRRPLVKQDREEASTKRDAIKSLEKDLENYKKSQQN